MVLTNQIINDDCLNVIENLPNNSIDVCLTDPPYGIDYQSAWRTDRSEWKPKIQNDNEPFTEWIKPLYSKMKEGGRLLCFYRWDVQDEFLNEIKSAGFIVKSQIVWDKGIHGMGDLKGEFAPQHESIIYATKGRYTFQGKRPTTVFKVQRVNPTNQVHPNENPIELLKQLLLSISTENELVVDLFGGSFSTYIASLSLNRRCITCELSKEYFEIGMQNVMNNSKIETNFF